MCQLVWPTCCYMASVDTNAHSSIQYTRQALIRAERAVRCSPFLIDLFRNMQHQSVALRAIAGNDGFRNRYTRRPVPELMAESQLLWLIETGILRREVDGQGITDSFRLTPLGRQLLEKWQQTGSATAPSLLDHVLNALNRWFRLRFA